ncbi:phage protein [Isoalcanivorax pacificus W11-5]|uniref:Phage protein n=1 Tax=Isoalcanivorax pacificus W11-5 TaxID=391936 RepID=A0A0B4XT57_9GAMM|nr:AAA family ATPase [Isoalcanivorax pacificus]AJD49698.1 phage protein [Isoalcanivorax pacificus W11-5]
MSEMIQIRNISFLGARVPPALIDFDESLSVVCGASDTGKSFLVEAIDFLLGGKELRGIPELDGYDKARIAIESSKKGLWTFERSIDGGNYRIYEGNIKAATDVKESGTIKVKHAAGREDNISGWLLGAIDLLSKYVRKNANGDCRSLSFRDIARLIIVNEQEIIRQDSPFLTGQYISRTAEKSSLKLVLTGADDSAIEPADARKQSDANDRAKAELIEQWIADVEDEITEHGFGREELEEQLEKIDESISFRREQLQLVQSQLNEMTVQRREIVRSREAIKDRIDDIADMLERFDLLKSQYVIDLHRLMAIEESGSLFVHHERAPCPLCGASPEAQHSTEECDGDIESIVIAAAAEMEKIKRLASDLDSTVTALREEYALLSEDLIGVENKFNGVDSEIRSAVAPELSDMQSRYSDIVDMRSKVVSHITVFTRLDKLLAQREKLFGDSGGVEAGDKNISTKLSHQVLHDFSKTVERILEAWDFPDTGGVHFDEATMDFVINGKLRGNRGKGLRAITHAAATLGLLEFCKERSLPHPGFVVLDSPLLAYYKPEGEGDSLQGTNLKQKFYKYLIEEHSDSQVIIVENEHPPESFEGQLALTVFTKNPQHGRFGLFPPKEIK